MSLKERLLEDMKTAMKEKDKDRLSVIRMVRAAIQRMEKDTLKELGEEEVLMLLTKEVKQRRDAIPDFQRGNRNDLVEAAEREIAILTSYLPQQLQESELKSIIEDAIRETGASTVKDLGKIMAIVVPKTRGRADGKAVQALVKTYLQ